MIKIIIIALGVTLSSLLIGAGIDSETKVVKETVSSVPIKPLKGLVAVDKDAF